MPKDRFHRDRERRLREATQFNRLSLKHYRLGSEAVSLKSFQKEISPYRVSCMCGAVIIVSVEEQKKRSIILCPKCGERYRASLGSISPIAGGN